MQTRLVIKFAKGCAWRATYLYVVRGEGKVGDSRKIAHISVDPTADSGPRCSGSVGSFSWRFALPQVRWKSGAGPIRRKLATISSRFWYSLDGRRVA